MSYILTLLLLLILAACVGSLYTEGIWSNSVRLINVVTAALLATNFYEPMAQWLENYLTTWTYILDFVSLWVLFLLGIVSLGELTNRVSRVKVRFLKIADQVGGGIIAFLIGWVVVCFTLMSLHTAPLSRNFLFGGFTPESKMFLGSAPDRKWLGFMQMESCGAFCWSPVAEFDPKNEFVQKYVTRRTQVADLVSSRDTIFGAPAAVRRPGGPPPGERKAGGPPPGEQKAGGPAPENAKPAAPARKDRKAARRS